MTSDVFLHFSFQVILQTLDGLRAAVVIAAVAHLSLWICFFHFIWHFSPFLPWLFFNHLSERSCTSESNILTLAEEVSSKNDLQALGQLSQSVDAARFISPLWHHFCSHFSDFISDVLFCCPGIPDISCGRSYKTSDFLGQG